MNTQWPSPISDSNQHEVVSSLCSTELSGSVLYFKRFKMEIDLPVSPAWVENPASEYEWIPWEGSLLDDHATALYESFVDEIDSIVFPSLSTLGGCRFLMSAISHRPGFVPETTWLVRHAGQPVGSIQGIAETGRLGAIQNLGVVRSHRGKGLGASLMMRALMGFAQVGMRRAFLEVTAQNEAAVRLYRRLGFRRRKTLYKPHQSPVPAILVD